jgi:hypothetical protein
MESYPISQSEIKDLKQTMGFRVNGKVWSDFAESHADGCTSVELIELVKKWMNPPYEVEGDLDEYLESILRLFVDFVRHSERA